MELRINIGFDQILNIIGQLPENQISKLRAVLETESFKKDIKNETSSFQQFLLNGPVMNSKQFEKFTENRKRMNKWRKK
jgi:hypothetical protein